MAITANRVTDANPILLNGYSAFVKSTSLVLPGPLVLFELLVLF
jgi:hypothetical protein